VLTRAQAMREAMVARDLDLLNTALALGAKLMWLPEGARVRWGGGVYRVAEDRGDGGLNGDPAVGLIRVVQTYQLHPGGTTVSTRVVDEVLQLPTAFQGDPLDLLQPRAR
jgi:hypothetical protein